MTNARLITSSILLFIIGALIGFRSATWMFLFLLGPRLSQDWLTTVLVDAIAFHLRTALLLGIHFAAVPIALLICPSSGRRGRLAIALIAISSFTAIIVGGAYAIYFRSLEAHLLSFAREGVTPVIRLSSAPFGRIFLSGSLAVIGIATVLRLKTVFSQKPPPLPIPRSN